MKKILLDTDIGCDMDDMQALAYLLARDDAEILGITTVTGEPEARETRRHHVQTREKEYPDTGRRGSRALRRVQTERHSDQGEGAARRLSAQR